MSDQPCWCWFRYVRYGIHRIIDIVTILPRLSPLFSGSIRVKMLQPSTQAAVVLSKLRLEIITEIIINKDDIKYHRLFTKICSNLPLFQSKCVMYWRDSVPFYHHDVVCLPWFTFHDAWILIWWQCTIWFLLKPRSHQLHARGSWNSQCFLPLVAVHRLLRHPPVVNFNIIKSIMPLRQIVLLQ